MAIIVNSSLLLLLQTQEDYYSFISVYFSALVWNSLTILLANTYIIPNK